MMSPEAKKAKSNDPKDADTKAAARKPLTFFGRDGLGAYINNPAGFPPSRVIYYNEGFVAINDLYPKSSVHTLLLPRSSKSLLHPFEAFEDLDFLAKVKEEAKNLRTLVAKELRRIYGRYSAQEQARERALNGIDDVEQLPPGRDWGKDIMVGIHAHPSMNHLHVHVLSVDRFSKHLKHRKHYNSFSTPFFVPLEDFPLAKDDVRRHPGREGYLNSDFKCWRCGRDFGRSFSKLEEHLAEEFANWKTE